MQTKRTKALKAAPEVEDDGLPTLRDDAIPTRDGKLGDIQTGPIYHGAAIQAADVSTSTSSQQATPDVTALAHGASRLILSENEDAILAEPVPDEDVEIRPDGIVYMSHPQLRRRLNAALGRGQWCLVPQGEPLLNAAHNTVSRVFHLFARGCFVKEAMGEQEYYPDSRTMSYADALEGAESNALSRSAKALSVGLELWDKRWIEGWRSRMAVQVYVKKKNGESKREWRRKDSSPLPGETGPANGNGHTVAAPASSSRLPTKPKPAAAKVIDAEPVHGDDPAGLTHLEVALSNGKKFSLRVHPDYTDKTHNSSGKLVRMFFIAQKYAETTEGLKGDEAKEWAYDALNNLAAELGHAHYSLIPWRGKDYDNVVAAFEKGGD